MGAFMEAFNNELAESGELVETRGLAAPVHTRRVRLQDGVPVVTDGPYAETQEVLAGYWIVECESFDRATEIAARLADCPARARRPQRTPTSGRSSTARDELDVLTRCTDRQLEDLLRQLAPQVLGAVVRRYGHFDTAEDAVQEALIAAAAQWPTDGIPDNPRGWLITVASRRLTDLLRSEQARRRREDTVARGRCRQWPRRPAPTGRPDADDTLDPAVHVLPPVAVAGLADRADAAGGRRSDHRGDRPRVPRARSRR